MVARHTTKFVHIVMCTTFTKDGFPDTNIVRVCKDEDAAIRFSEKCQWGTPEEHATYSVAAHVLYDDE
jgi:hypothetical protein